MNKKVLHEALDHTAMLYPGNVAIRDGDVTVSYAELYGYSTYLAGALAAHGFRKGQVVVLFLEASAEGICGAIGVNKAGGIFVSLEPDLPRQRLRFILAELNPAYVITRPGLAAQWAELLPPGAACLPLYADVAAWQRQAAGQPPNPPAVRSVHDGDDPCYIVYTSGSTGEPKGIVAVNKGLSHFIHWEKTEFGLGPHTRAGLLTPLSFDVSLRDIFVPLLSGGQLHIPGKSIKTSPREMLAWIAGTGINLLHVVPSVLRMWLQSPAPEGGPETQLQSLRHILFAGEPLYYKDVAAWKPLLHEAAELVNLYGPSETTLAKLFHRIGETGAPQQVVPLGAPVSNTEVLIIRNNRLCKPNEPGEICIKTPFRSRGYLNDPELTAAKFVQNPLHDTFRDIIFRTGDVGYYREDGRIGFVGRGDRQAKINGSRVELLEVEKAALTLDTVRQALALAVPDPQGNQQLALYYTGAPGCDEEALSQRLEEMLPGYMLPSYLVRLEHFPLNRHGKVNLRELAQRKLAGDGNDKPEGELEQRIAGIWSSVLGHAQFGRNTSFFRSGGSSIQAIQVMARLIGELQANLKLRDMFEQNTISRLARFIRPGGPRPVREPGPVEEQEHYGLSPAQHHFWLVDSIEKNPEKYIIPLVHQLEGDLDVALLRKALQWLTDRHEALRTSFFLASGELRQRVHEDLSFPLECPALPAGPLETWLSEEVFQPFDLGQAPLLRARLFGLEPGKHLLVLAFHHIIADLWSVEVFTNELLLAYRAFRRGEAPGLPPLPLQYKDYVQWINALVASGEMKKSRDFWTGQLGREADRFEWPAEYAAHRQQASSAQSITGTLDGPETEALAGLCTNHDASFFTGLLSVLLGTVYLITGRRDLLVAIPLAGRDHPVLQNQVGLYFNLIAVRFSLEETDDFTRLVTKVKDRLLDAFQHAHYPWSHLLEEAKNHRHNGQLFHIGFNFNNLRLGQAGTGDAPDGLQSVAVDDLFRFSKSDFWVNAVEAGSSVALRADYNTDVLRPEGAGQLLACYRWLTKRVTAAGRPSLRQLREELAQLHEQQRKESRKALKDKNLHDLMHFKATL